MTPFPSLVPVHFDDGEVLGFDGVLEELDFEELDFEELEELDVFGAVNTGAML